MVKYIDSDDAVQCAADLAKDFSDEGFHAEASGAYAVWEWLQDIPAADVRPVVRGKWELSDDLCWHTCSECGADIDVSVGLLCYVDNEEVCTHNFCPNCGADMREES